MTKNTLQEQKQNSASKHQDLFKRRPIRPIPNEEQQHSDEDESEMQVFDNGKNSPKKPKKVNPGENKMGEINEDEETGEKYKQNKLNGSYLSSYSALGLIIVLLVSCCLYFLLLFLQKPVTELSVQEKLKNMEGIFQDQNSFTFRILKSALNKVVNVTQESSAPAIFTVTVNKNAIYKSHEFSHYLADILAPQNLVLINESKSWHNNPNDIKLEIDNKIKSKAKEKSLFIVIVDNLHNIPLKTAMLFHHYCDHEAAPFKHGIFLFIVPLNEILPKDTSIKNIDKAALSHLKSIWSKASSDEIDSLITRITVNVINIR